MLPVTLTGPTKDAVFATVSVFVNTFVVLRGIRGVDVAVTLTGPHERCRVRDRQSVL
jgi:hypothetical protein